jgi:hypothetical protein
MHIHVLNYVIYLFITMVTCFAGSATFAQYESATCVVEPIKVHFFVAIDRYELGTPIHIHIHIHQYMIIK